MERLHRRLLDVIKDEFDRRSRTTSTPVQALLLFNIGDKELTAGELRTRGYYLGSNLSYNVKNWSRWATSIMPARASTAARSASADGRPGGARDRRDSMKSMS